MSVRGALLRVEQALLDRHHTDRAPAQLELVEAPPLQLGKLGLLEQVGAHADRVVVHAHEVVGILARQLGQLAIDEAAVPVGQAVVERQARCWSGCPGSAWRRASGPWACAGGRSAPGRPGWPA